MVSLEVNIQWFLTGQSMPWTIVCLWLIEILLTFIIDMHGLHSIISVTTMDCVNPIIDANVQNDDKLCTVSTATALTVIIGEQDSTKSGFIVFEGEKSSAYNLYVQWGWLSLIAMLRLFFLLFFLFFVPLLFFHSSLLLSMIIKYVKI